MQSGQTTQLEFTTDSSHIPKLKTLLKGSPNDLLTNAKVLASGENIHQSYYILQKAMVAIICSQPLIQGNYLKLPKVAFILDENQPIKTIKEFSDWLSLALNHLINNAKAFAEHSLTTTSSAISPVVASSTISEEKISGTNITSRSSSAATISALSTKPNNTWQSDMTLLTEIIIEGCQQTHYFASHKYQQDEEDKLYVQAMNMQWIKLTLILFNYLPDVAPLTKKLEHVVLQLDAVSYSIENNVTALENLLNQHPSFLVPGTGFGDIYEVLFHACYRGHLAIVQLLLTNGVQMNIHFKNIPGGFTPINIACGNGKIEVANFILNNVNNAANFLNGENCTAIDSFLNYVYQYTEVENGTSRRNIIPIDRSLQKDILELLLEHGGTFNPKKTQDLSSPNYKRHDMQTIITKYKKIRSANNAEQQKANAKAKNATTPAAVPQIEQKDTLTKPAQRKNPRHRTHVEKLSQTQQQYFALAQKADADEAQTLLAPLPPSEKTKL